MLLDPVSGTIKRIVAGRTPRRSTARISCPTAPCWCSTTRAGSRHRADRASCGLNLVDGSAHVVFPSDAGKSMLPFFSPDGGSVVPSPDGTRAMVASQGTNHAPSRSTSPPAGPLWKMTRVLDVGPFMKSDKPVAGYFKAYGTYYLTNAQAKALPLR